LRLAASASHSSCSRRKRVKGKRLPTLEHIAQDRKTKWQRVVIPDWYGTGRRSVEIVSNTAVWYHAGQPPLAIRWVVNRLVLHALTVWNRQSPA
jgi:hypothetical protein